MTVEDEENRQLLKDEYLLLHNIYEDFDRRRLTIKGWIGAGAMAGLALGLDNSRSIGGHLWPIAAALAGCFWIIEWRWKIFQDSHQGRIYHIERIFRGDRNVHGIDAVPFQIFCWWDKTFAKWTLRKIGVIFIPSVMLPYAPIIGFCAWAWWVRLGV